MNFLLKFLSTPAEASAVADSVEASAETSTAELTGFAGFFAQYGMLIVLVVFVVIFYFISIRPEKKRRQKAEKERSSLKVGDTVISIGGITGEVEQVNNDTVTIFTGDGSIDLQKWAIRSVVENTEADGEDSNNAE